MALIKVGDLVSTNVEAPSHWGVTGPMGLIVEVSKHKPRRGLPRKVRVRWVRGSGASQSQWHYAYNLKIVSEAL
jgi:hypothetical protein